MCVLALAGLYVPWLIVWRTSFLYYLTPLVLFMAIAAVWALRRVWRGGRSQRVRRGAVIGYLVAAFVATTLLAPVWLGLPIGARYWRRLMIFRTWI